MTKVIGLTGGIASGKSTVSTMLANAGLPIVDADQVTRQLQAPGSRGLLAIENAFGPQVLTADGQLNRQSLGQIVFTDSAQRQKLNRIMQPLIWESLWEQVAYFKQQTVPAVVIDAPLLFEQHYAEHCDLVIVVQVSPKVQIDRLMKRDHLNYQAAAARIASQWSLAKKAALADVVINNDGSQEDLRRQVDALLNQID